MLPLLSNFSPTRTCLIVFAVLSCLNGCANYPEQERISSFGAAAVAVSGAGSSAFQTSSSIARELAVETETLGYINRNFRYPPRYDEFSPGDLTQWKVRLDLLQKINAYSEELKKISAPGAAKKAADSANKLTAAVLGAIPDSSIPIAGDAFPKVVAGSVQIGANLFLASRMRSVMRQTHPVLVRAVALLKEDFELLVRIPKINADALEKTRADTLRRLREDPDNSTVELRTVYLELVSLDRKTKAAVSSVNKLPSALDKLVAAHAAVMDSSDNDRALSELIAASETISGGLSSLLTQN